MKLLLVLPCAAALTLSGVCPPRKHNGRAACATMLETDAPLEQLSFTPLADAPLANAPLTGAMQDSLAVAGDAMQETLAAAVSPVVEYVSSNSAGQQLAAASTATGNGHVDPVLIGVLVAVAFPVAGFSIAAFVTMLNGGERNANEESVMPGSARAAPRAAPRATAPSPQYFTPPGAGAGAPSGETRDAPAILFEGLANLGKEPFGWFFGKPSALTSTGLIPPPVAGSRLGARELARANKPLSYAKPQAFDGVVTPTPSPAAPPRPMPVTAAVAAPPRPVPVAAVTPAPVAAAVAAVGAAPVAAPQPAPVAAAVAAPAAAPVAAPVAAAPGVAAGESDLAVQLAQLNAAVAALSKANSALVKEVEEVKRGSARKTKAKGKK